MSEDVPRRLRRFQRNGEIPVEAGEIEFGEAGYAKAEEMEFGEAGYAKAQAEKKEELGKEVTMQLALDEVQRFKEEHNRLPKKEEYDQIAESIYSQLRDEEQRARVLERLERQGGERLKPSERARQREERKAERQLPSGRVLERKKESAFAEMQEAAKGLGEQEVKGMSVEDLFEGEKKEKKESIEKQGNEEFSLGGLTDLESQSSEPSGEKCPNCGTKTGQVIFCPECGTAFCERCADRVERMGEFTTIVCPDCKAKIKK